MRRAVAPLVASVLAASSVLGAAPSGAATTSARVLLSRLAVAQEVGTSTSTFARSAFGGWRDADGDGCDTRAEVLQAESRTAVTLRAGCEVVLGQWRSAYDGQVRSRASGLVVDPMVPLRETWESGAREWSDDTRGRFRNDLGAVRSLVAVTTSSTADRGSRDPSSWLPQVDRCAYVTRWLLVKYRWSLSVDRREKVALSDVLSGRCGDRAVTVPHRSSIELMRKPAPMPPTPTTSPAPATTAPATTAPATTAPVTTAPVTTAPVTTAPVTTAPVTTAPVTTAPVTTAPATTSPSPDTVTVSGTVHASTAEPFADAVVAVEGAAGTVLAQTRTDASGAFVLRAAVGAVRLVVGSGAVNRQASALPGTFRWQSDLALTSDVSLPIVLPATRRVAVVATQPGGRPLAGAAVRSPGEAPVRAGALWPGGPLADGVQSAAPEPVVTGFDGRAALWAFPTGDLATTYVDQTSDAGILQRATASGVAVDGDTMLVAVPASSGCLPRQATDMGAGTVRLVADLDRMAVRDSASKAALLRAADQVVTGEIPAVTYNTERTGDSTRYLYDEGAALRRMAGVLAYAYAVTRDRTYLRTMATKVALNAAGWPDWNPGHPLDTVQVATAVSLAYGWSGPELTAAERAEVVDALLGRMLLPYSCSDGQLVGYRTAVGNQSTLAATAAVLAGVAVRNDVSAWGSVAVADATASLARFRLADDAGRSLAGGPTVEGLMYTSYEAANLALLHTTRWRNADDPAVSAALGGSLAELDVLAAWNERCGTVVDPDVEDAWDVYPWVDRTTALAAMTAWATAGSHVLELLEALQARDSLTVPDRGTWTVPDGIAELVASGLSPNRAAPPVVQSFAPRAGAAGSYWGCATNGALRALLSAAPNDAPHAHRDIGNMVVSHGDQPVLADLGQRDYGFSARYVWRGLTKAHNTLGVLQPDGRVTQTDAGSGSVSAPDGGLLMVSANAMAGVDWSRGLTVTDSTVTVRDQLSLRTPGTARPMSMSFLLPTPVARVSDLGGGLVRFAFDDGSTWELVAPHATSVSVTDAQPTPPYDDTAEFKATLGTSHSLVVLGLTLVDRLDLTTTVRQVSPAS